MAHPVIMLWTAPRSRSTAFERMMIERGDHTVLDEPFSARYYFSSERRSDRFTESEPGATGSAVLGEILAAAEEAPVFVKDMAYHATGLLSSEFLAHFTNTFLIREPAAALGSLARRWPDLTAEEAGYDALGVAFELVRKDAPGGHPPIVMDGDELAADPDLVVARWCERLRIAFDPHALSWCPGMVPQWTRWQDWYSGVAESSGFVAPEHPRDRPHTSSQLTTDPTALAGEAAAVLERARRVYEELSAVRIR